MDILFLEQCGKLKGNFWLNLEWGSIFDIIRYIRYIIMPEIQDGGRKQFNSPENLTF